MADGAKWVSQRDLASSHASKIANGAVDSENVDVLRWLPAGADLNPLAVYVNPAAGGLLRGKDPLARGNLEKETAVALKKMRASRKYKEMIAGTCKSFEKRARRAANDGREKVIRKKSQQGGKSPASRIIC